MEKKMEHEMEAGGIQGFQELNFHGYMGEPYYLSHIYIYVHIYIPIMVT